MPTNGKQSNGVVRRLKLIGADEQKQEEFRDRIAGEDDCFGEMYDEQSDICDSCTAPVVIGGEIHLFKEVCKAQCEGNMEPYRLNRLTSADVMDRLSSGASVEDLFVEILNGSGVDQAGKEARRILYQRLYYLRKEKGLPVPEVPSLKELKDHVTST